MFGQNTQQPTQNNLFGGQPTQQPAGAPGAPTGAFGQPAQQPGQAAAPNQFSAQPPQQPGQQPAQPGQPGQPATQQPGQPAGGAPQFGQAPGPQPGAPAQPSASANLPQIPSGGPAPASNPLAPSSSAPAPKPSAISKKSVSQLETESLQRSHSALFRFLSRHFNHSSQKLEKHKQTIIDMLSPALLWFKVGQEQQKEPTGTPIWSDYLLNVAHLQSSEKTQVSAELNNELVRQMQRILGMHYDDALKLVDSFFGEKSSKFEYLHLLEDRIVQLQDRLMGYVDAYMQKQAQAGFGQINPHFRAQYLEQLKASKDLQVTQMSAKLEEMQDHFLNKIVETRTECLKYFFEERQFQLSSLLNMIIFTESTQNKTVELIRDQILSKDLVKNLLKSLHRNLKWAKEFKIDRELELKFVIKSIQSEQQIILQILLLLSGSSEFQKPQVTISHLAELFSYLKKTNFEGLLIEDISEHNLLMNEEGMQSQVQGQQVLKDLGLVTFLSGLRVQLFVKHANPAAKDAISQQLFKDQAGLTTLKNELTDLSLNPISAILGIAVVETAKANQAPVNFESLRNKVISENFMLEVDRLLVESPLMTIAVSQQNLAKDVLQTFYGLLVLIFPHSSLEVKEKIHHLTYSVFLKNKHVLQDICRSLSQSDISECSALKMFEDQFQQPFRQHNAPLYSYVLKLLCGKTRVRTASLIFDFVNKEQNGILPLEQIIVGLVTLFAQLLIGDVNQNTLDIFMNYLITLTKFLKQDISTYEQINSILLNLIQNKDELQDDFEILLEHGFDNRHLAQALDAILEPLFFFQGTTKVTGGETDSPRLAEDPLVVLLIRIMFVLAKMDYSLAIPAQKHVVDSLCIVFSAQDHTKKSILDLIQIMQEFEGGYSLCSYFQDTFLNVELRQKKFPVTLAFLKFVGRIFKTDIPQVLLNQRWMKDLDDSFLKEMLTSVFVQIFDKFDQIETNTVTHLAKVQSRVIKLVAVLLDKFDCGTNTPIQVPIQQHNPRFDSLLHIILTTLNKLNLSPIVQTLRLTDSTSHYATGLKSYQKLQNHLLLALQMSGAPPHPGHGGDQLVAAAEELTPHQVQILNKMISRSLRCLNTMAKLAVSKELHELYVKKSVAHRANERRPNSQKDSRSLQQYYIALLKCISELQAQIMQPTSENMHEVNLISLVAYYARVELLSTGSSYQFPMIPAISNYNNMLAQDFLTSACQLWQTMSPTSRIDFRLILIRNGFIAEEDLKHFFLLPLVAIFTDFKESALAGACNSNSLGSEAIRGRLRYLAQTLELFCISAQSQFSLIDLLFSQDVACKQLAPLIGSFFAQVHQMQTQKGIEESLSRLLGSISGKLVSLLHIMTAERVGMPFIRVLFGFGADGDGHSHTLNSIINSFILPHCIPKGLSTFDDRTRLQSPSADNGDTLIDYYAQQQEEEEQNKINQVKVVEHCTAVSTLSEFLILVQNLFQMDCVSNAKLREVVQDLFSNESFGNFFSLNSTEKITNHLSIVLGDLELIGSIFMKKKVDKETANFISADFETMFSNLVSPQFAHDLYQNAGKLMDVEQASTSTQNHELASLPYIQAEGIRSSNAVGPVQLKSLDGFEQERALKFLKGRHFQSSYFATMTLTTAEGEGAEQEAGAFGANFMIPTKQLRYALLTNGYFNLNAVNMFITNCQMYNLCTSCLVAQTHLEQVKSDFILSIGKSKMNANQRDLTQSSKLSSLNMSYKLLSSLFPLVDKDFPKKGQQAKGSQAEMKPSVQILIRRFLKVAEDIFHKLPRLDPSQPLHVNQVGLLHNEALFELLEVALSSLNVCVAPAAVQEICQLGDFPEVNQLQRFVSQNLLTHLTEIYNNLTNQIQKDAQYQGLPLSTQNERNTHDDPATFAMSAVTIAPQERQNRSQKLFQQVVLSAYQILESITKDQQFSSAVMKQETDGILNCSAHIVKIMQTVVQAQKKTLQPTALESHKKLFRDCLRTLQVSIDLLSEDTVEDFMHGHSNKPLRTIIGRFIDSQISDVEETIMVIEFLITYADLRGGALHLFGENIFVHLLKNKCVTKAKNEPFYKREGTSNQGETRNPFHVLWCKVLLLLRTLNSNLLEEDPDDFQVRKDLASTFDPQCYLRSLINYLTQQEIDKRLAQVLSQTQYSQAYLEEAELVSALVSQLFLKADALNSSHHGLVQGLKDQLVFGFSTLFPNFQQEKFSTQVATQAEGTLKAMTAPYVLRLHSVDPNERERVALLDQSFSLLNLKTQVHLIKIYMTYSQSLINLMLLDKEQSQMVGQAFHDSYEQSQKSALFPANWNYIIDKLSNLHQHKDFNSSYLCKEHADSIRHFLEQNGYGSLLRLALESIFQAQEVMRQIYGEWNASLKKTKILFDDLVSAFVENEETTSEYFGLNSLLIPTVEPESQEAASSFEQFISQFESSLQAGNHLMILLLEKLAEAVNHRGLLNGNSSVSPAHLVDLGSKVNGSLVSFMQDVKLYADQPGLRLSQESTTMKQQMVEQTEGLCEFVGQFQACVSEKAAARAGTYSPF